MTQEVGDVRKEMRAYVEENFLYLHPDTTLGDSDQFLALGIVDSLSSSSSWRRSRTVTGSRSRTSR